MTSRKIQLVQAASNGDCETLKTLLRPDPSQTLQEASITLEKLVATAAAKGNASVVEYGVTLGANVNDYNVVQAVTEGRSLDVYKSVVPAGYKLNRDYGFVGGPLSWVGNDVPLAAYLLEHGANPNNEMQSAMYQPMALAARNPNDNAEMIELFIRHGAQIDRSGALLVAAEHGNLEAARCLISHAANVNLCQWRDTFVMRPGREETALHRAVKSRHESIVALLLESGADTKLKDAQGKTALDLAREMEVEGLVQLLQAHS